MNSLYDIKYLYDTLFLLQTQIDELSQWSVYNDDVCLDQIHELTQKFEEVKKQLFELAKDEPLEANLTEKGGETLDGITKSAEK